MFRTTLFLLLLVLSRTAIAQQVRVAMQRGPYYVGEPMVVQVQVDGVTSGKQPSCKMLGKSPGHLQIQGPRMNRSIQSSIQIFNGKMTRRESADYQFNFVVTASRPGEFTVGPFQAIVDGTKRSIPARSIKFEKLMSDPDMEIHVAVPRTRIYVGEQIPVTIRWAYAGELDQVRYAFSNLQIRSPLFDQFSFRDVRAKTRTTLSLVTAKGEVQLDSTVRKQKKGGKEFVVVEGKRTLVADAPGTFESPITCRTKKVTRWRRDFFGDLVPARMSPALSAGKPLKLEVRPIPLVDRPASFAGAVGKDFTIEVAANRTVVRVGDPIALEVTVRGKGDLERLSLPRLSGEGGLDEDEFQLSKESPTGTVGEESKQFKVEVRAKNVSVKEVPPIAFSWFDPEAERFVTARSKPVSLEVMKAQIVSAANVVSGSKATQANKDQQNATAISVAGANLAIEKDPARLQSVGSNSSTVTIVLYGAGAVVLAFGVLLRYRQKEDSAAAKIGRQLKHQRQSIAKAATLSQRDAAEQIATALRNVQAANGNDDERDAIERLVGKCDSQSYAPADDGQQSVKSELVQEAMAIVDRLLDRRTDRSESRQ